MVVRNEVRRRELERDGLAARRRVPKRSEHATIRTTAALDDDYDLVIVAVQRQQVDALIPTLAANGSRRILFMFNNASGADQWADRIGRERQLWGFPAVLADRPSPEPSRRASPPCEQPASRSSPRI